MDNTTYYTTLLKKFYSMNKIQFGDTIHDFRSKNKMRVKDLALKLKESTQTVIEAETGKLNFLLYLKIIELFEENGFKWKT